MGINNDNKISEDFFTKSFQDRIRFALKKSVAVFKMLWWVIALGIAIGAIIHGYVPKEFFEKYIGVNSFLSVPIATLVGVPIYAGCSTIVPIAFALTTKGIPLGTTLAFMMSIAGLSLPEAIMLKKALSMKLLVSFFGIVALGIILIGYLFNLLRL